MTPNLFRAPGSTSTDSMHQRRTRAVRVATAVAPALAPGHSVVTSARRCKQHDRSSSTGPGCGQGWDHVDPRRRTRARAGALGRDARRKSRRSDAATGGARYRWTSITIAITFWRHVEGSCDGPHGAVTAGSLRRLHSALADYPARLHSFGAELDELATALADPARRRRWIAPIEHSSDRRFVR
jgi:hypothetical protein